MTAVTETQPVEATAIRPFTFEAAESDLEELRARIAATRWPGKEPVDDQSQGVQLATIKALAHYWQTEYDWRKCEARLSALPQFMTEIDGVDIHFIHVRSKHEDALPLIVTHGWPGSIVEQLKIIDPLTNPTAHGGSASDAFHVVVPSLPGYGFSGKPTTTGWDPTRIARAWTVLMKRLGYDRFVAQGGDWGAMVADVMGTQAPPELLGIHVTWPFTVPPEIDQAVQTGKPLPADLSADEQHGGVVGTHLLGEQDVHLLRAEERHDPGRRDSLPGRGRTDPAQLDRARLSGPRLLQQGRQGRALRGLGAAATVRRRSSRGLQIASIDASG